MVFYLLMTSMALYAAQRFQAADSVAGFASSAFIIGALLSRFFAGPLLDTAGRRRVLVVSLAVFTAVSLLYIPASSLALLLVLRLVHGVAFGIGHTAVTAGAQALIPAARRGEGTGYFTISTSVATALGPLLAVLLSAGGDYDGVFLFCAACSAAAFAVSLFLRLPARQPAGQPAATAVAGGPGGKQRAWTPRTVLDRIVEPAVLPIASVMLVGCLAYSGVLSFLTSYAEQRGAAPAAALFFLVFAAAVLTSRLFAGRIQDRRGANIVMYPALVVFAAGLALLAPGVSMWNVVGSGVLTGLGFGTLMPCTQAIAVNQVPERRLGTAVATFYLMLDVGTGFGPVLLGLLVPFTGFEGMYVWLGVLMLACIGLYYAVHGRKRQAPVPA
ncbi:MFS transporter [Arthrobacter sp. E918]|uniref:MFS transporter n=2 Tax=Arthrobacter mobilis TaxID=2724944 RepID=A0A7X6K4C4_9MICC|nr:MFS transporter [Arthrobacter mobilis]